MSHALVTRVGVSTVAHVRWVCIAMVLLTRIQLPIATAIARLHDNFLEKKHSMYDVN